MDFETKKINEFNYIMTNYKTDKNLNINNILGVNKSLLVKKYRHIYNILYYRSKVIKDPDYYYLNKKKNYYYIKKNNLS